MDMISVRRVLDAHWDQRLPIDPVAIAKKLGYEVKVFPSGSASNLSGMACVEGNKKVIYFKKDEYLARKRFTIAHEIGHHQLGHTENGRHCRDNVNISCHTSEEVEANQFAAELLMPQDLIKMMVRREGVTDINELASIFCVSPAAMYWRLKNIGMI